MKLWTGLARWASRTRDRSRPPELDPADMGTAFGLDASFAQAQTIDPPAPPAPRMPWDLRLVRRPQR